MTLGVLTLGCARHLQTLATRFSLAMLLAPAYLLYACIPGCGAAKNDHFSLSLEDSQTVRDDGSDPSPPLRCNADTDLGCGTMDFVTAAGDFVHQPDAQATCSTTQSGDLKVELIANPEPSQFATALFRVHRNTAPQGNAQCQGIVSDPASQTGYARSSCDVIIRFGSKVFAATEFEPCSATVEAAETLRGTIRCPLLVTGQQSLIVNRLSFFCVIEETTSALRAGNSRP